MSKISVQNIFREDGLFDVCKVDESGKVLEVLIPADKSIVHGQMEITITVPAGTPEDVLEKSVEQMQEFRTRMELHAMAEFGKLLENYHGFQFKLEVRNNF